MAEALPDDFFKTQDELDGKEGSTTMETLPDNFFLSQVEVDAIDEQQAAAQVQMDLQEDIPTETAPYPIQELSPQERLEKVPTVGGIISEEFNRFTDSYGPTRVAKDFIADAASVKGSVDGYKAGKTITDALGVKHPLAKTAIIAVSSAVSVGLHQFAGEIAESAIKDEEFSFKDASNQSIESAAWDAGGNLVLGTFGVVSRKAIQMSGIDMSDAKKAAQAILAKYGTTLTRYQITGTKASKAIEAISTLGLDFLSSVKKVGEKQQLALSSELDTMLKGVTSVDTGKKIIGAHTAALSSISAEYGEVLKAVLAKVPTDEISLKGFIGWNKANRIKGAGAQKLKNAVETNEYRAKVNSLTTNLRQGANFEQISITLGKLGEVAREAKAIGNRVGHQYATEVRNQLEGVMDDAAQKLGPEFKTEYDALRSWYKGSITKLNSTVMDKAVKQNPSALGEYLAASPESVVGFKTFLGEAINRGVLTKKEAIGAINEVRKGYLNTLIKGAPTIGEMKTLGKTLRGKKERELAIKVLGAPQYNRMLGILETVELVTKNVDGGQQFGLMVASKNAQAVKQGLTLGVASGSAATMSLPAALVILTAPTVLGKVAASAPKARQWTKLSEFIYKAQRIGDKEITRVALSRYNSFMSELEKEDK